MVMEALPAGDRAALDVQGLRGRTGSPRPGESFARLDGPVTRGSVE